MIAAGDLRHRVTIQVPVESQDEHLAPTTGWRDVATAWASVSPLSAREQMAAQQIQSTVTHRIKMRWRPGVSEVNRLVMGGRAFEIRAAMNVDERNEELLIMAEEKRR